MFKLNGKYNSCKVFTDNVDNETISQILTILNQEFAKDSKIRVMPDTHAGKGCVIGTTMTIRDKIVPNLVGVDIGCLDKETEILTPNGWIKICDYSNQDILIYDKTSDAAYFAKPYAYIKEPCSEFYHFHSTKGLDQMLSSEHKMLIWKGYKGKGYNQTIELAKDVFTDHNNHTKSNRAIKTTFKIENKGISLNNNMIRIMVMVSADGRIKHMNKNTFVELHFKKQRKIDRAEQLLKAENIIYNKYSVQDGSTYISFTITAFNTKSLVEFYHANSEQLKTLIDEIYYWDGTIDEKRNHKNYSTTDKANADVIQFALATCGIRAGIFTNNNISEHWNTQYNVYQTNNEYVGFPNKKFQTVNSEYGFKYCFTTPTGFFIIRRNNCISITGNCGMLAVQLEEKEIDLAKLDKVIHKYVPSGFNIHEHAISQSNADKILAPVNVENAFKSLGTLGGGNHFIEVDCDSNGNLWLVVHTGSRHLGIEVCKYYQDLAYRKIKNNGIKEKVNETIASLKAEGKQHDIESAIKMFHMQNKPISKDLCYLTGDDFANYIHDMYFAQEHAKINRKTIVEQIINHMGLHIVNQIDTIHNYIDIDNMILRKGSVSAKLNEKLIIPMNMRDGSLICIGKGNPDWNYSAPHGAGRIMSRRQAKDNISMDEYRQSMTGIYTSCINASTIDESPMVYKPIEEIMENIQDTVDVIDVIKPVYNYKAN